MIFSAIFKNYESLLDQSKISTILNPCIFTLLVAHMAATVSYIVLYLSHLIEIATIYICVDFIIIFIGTRGIQSYGKIDVEYLNHLCNFVQMLGRFNISLKDSDKVNNLISHAQKHTFHISSGAVKATLISIFSGLVTLIGVILNIASLIYEKGYEHWSEIQSAILDVTIFWVVTYILIIFTYYVSQKITYRKTNKYDRFIDDIKQAQLICNDQGVIEDKIIVAFTKNSNSLV